MPSASNRRNHPQLPTLTPQRRQMEMVPRIATLSRPQRSQPEKPHPDRYAGNCPARIETGQSSAAQAHNPQTHITPQPSRSQMKTVSPDRPRLTVPVLFHPHLSPPVSSPSPFSPVPSPLLPPSHSLSVAKQRSLPQTATLSRPHRSQPEKPHPDRYAGNCPARIETGQSSAAQAHNPQTHITPQPSRSQMKTVSPDRPRLTVPVLFHPHLSPPVSSPSPFSPVPSPLLPPSHSLSVAKQRSLPQTATLSRPHRSHMRAPSPNDYTQNPSPQPNGETIPKQLHSPPPSADRWKRLPQIPTLSHPHRSQTAEPSQNGHAQRVTNPANPTTNNKRASPVQ